MSFSRVRALVLVSALVVCAAVLVPLAILKDRQSNASYGTTSCPKNSVQVQTRPLPSEDQIKLNVYNGTARAGLANQVANDLRSRKFTVKKVTDNKTRYAGIAQILYGPKEVAAATVVNAYFLGNAKPLFDIKRTSDEIDVVLGGQYQALGTPTDVHQAYAQLGNPSPPPGTCDVSH